MNKIVRSTTLENRHDKRQNDLAKQLSSFRKLTNLRELERVDPRSILDDSKKTPKTISRFGWNKNFQKDDDFFQWEQMHSSPFYSPTADPSTDEDDQIEQRNVSIEDIDDEDIEEEVKLLRINGKWNCFRKIKTITPVPKPVVMVSCSLQLLFLFTKGSEMMGLQEKSTEIIEIIAMYAVDTLALPCEYPGCSGYFPHPSGILRSKRRYKCGDSEQHYKIYFDFPLIMPHPEYDDGLDRNSKRRKLDHTPRFPLIPPHLPLFPQLPSLPLFPQWSGMMLGEEPLI